MAAILQMTFSDSFLCMKIVVLPSATMTWISGSKKTHELWQSLVTVIWVRPWRCTSLVAWFCYQTIAKQNNKTGPHSRPDPYSGMGSLPDKGAFFLCFFFKQLGPWEITGNLFLCDNQVTTLYLNRWWSGLLIHINITQPQWIKTQDKEIYRQVSNIRRTKSQHLQGSRTVLQLSLPYPLKPEVKSRMKM